jgi:integrase/recombinase XerD
MDICTPHPSAAVSPLRQRMLDNMRMRQFAEHTQDGYIRAVRKLATFLGRSPHTATAEDLRRFQLHLVDTGTGPVTINATITGLKFFFDITLSRPELMLNMTHVAVPCKLPVILGPEEVGRLIAAAPNLKHQAAMSVTYGAGLRVSEVVSLKVGDIDDERMTLRVEQGKGRKDRYTMLSPVLLERLRAWWRRGPRPGQDPPRWLAVPGPGPHRPRHRAPAQPRRAPGRCHVRPPAARTAATR